MENKSDSYAEQLNDTNGALIYPTLSHAPATAERCPAVHFGLMLL